MPSTSPDNQSTTTGVSALPTCVASSAGVDVTLLGYPCWRLDDGSECRGADAAAALAAAFRARGIAALAQLRGRFAAVIDAGDAGFHLATDRMGSVPIYYSTCSTDHDNGEVAWSTDPSKLNRNGVALPPQAVYHYVYFHMVPGPGSAYPGVRKLPMASHVNLRAGGDAQEPPAARAWYRPSPGKQGSSRSERQALYGPLRDILAAAVKRALPDEGRVGAFLSGGLDSTTVVGMLAEQAGGRDIAAFSIGFDADGYDEMPYARLSAKHFGVTLHEYYVTPEDVVAELPRLAAASSEPFGNSSLMPAYFCAREASRLGYRTLLAGDGGDELFAGNTRYQKQLVFERYNGLPRALRRGIIEAVAGALPAKLPLATKARSFISQARTPLPARLHTYNFLHRQPLSEIFTDDFLATVDTSRPEQEQRAVYTAIDGSPLSRMLHLDWQYTLADNDLRKVTTACELADVAVQFPLLDDDLMDFAVALSDEAKLAGGELRGFFKEALRGWLPDATIAKSKHGFGLPFGVWMQTHEPLRDLARDAISALELRGIFRPDFIVQALRAHGEVHASYYGELIWVLTVLELWLRAHQPGAPGNGG